MSTPANQGQGSMQQEQSVMAGQGFYNVHSQPQHSASALGLPLLVHAAEAVALPEPDEVFVVADYGASEGRNSLEPMRTLIAAVRQRTARVDPITIFHTDLPANDFSSLFTLLQQSLDSYLAGTSNVFAYAVGRSFYEQIFPAAQVSLGWTSITVHWLSRVPCAIPDHIWSPRAASEVREVWAQQAQADWQRFLDKRATELRPGGQVVVVGSGVDEHGNSGAEGLMNMANAALQAMVHDGLLRSSEYARMVVPTFYRTVQEFTAPLSNGSVSNVLQLEEVSQAVLADPFWTQYEASGDAHAFAVAYAGFLRAFSEPSLFGVLDADRTPEERQRLADECYARVQQRVAANPAGAVCAWQLVLLRIAKRARSHRTVG